MTLPVLSQFKEQSYYYSYNKAECADGTWEIFYSTLTIINRLNSEISKVKDVDIKDGI